MNKNSTLYVVLFMIALTALFGLAVSFVHYATLDVLKKNASLHVNRALAEAFFLPVRGKSADAYRTAVEGHVRQRWTSPRRA